MRTLIGSIAGVMLLALAACDGGSAPPQGGGDAGGTVTVPSSEPTDMGTAPAPGTDPAQ